MKDENAEGFADVIMQNQEKETESFENALVNQLIDHALESEYESSSSSSEDEESD